MANRNPDENQEIIPKSQKRIFSFPDFLKFEINHINQETDEIENEFHNYN